MQPDQDSRYALVVEDHPLVAESLVACIRSCDAALAVSVAESLAAALRVIAVRSSPLLILSDLTLTDSDGTDSVRRLRDAAPHCPLVVFTALDEPRLRQEAEELGASHYLIKNTSTDALREAIRTFLSAVPGSAHAASIAMRGLRSGDPRGLPEFPLTPKQCRVLEEMAAGRGNKEIAVRLGVSVQTVGTHAKDIFTRLEVKNRTEAVVRYLQLIDPDSARRDA